MIDFVINLVYSFFLWGTFIAGLLFMLKILALRTPHLCWDQRESGRFDIAAIFCDHCITQLSYLFVISWWGRNVGNIFAGITSLYVIYLLVRTYYVDEMSVLEMVSVCLLLLLTKGTNPEIYVLHPNGTLMPAISGSCMFVFFLLYYRLSVCFMVVSLIFCIIGMAIYGLQPVLFRQPGLDFFMAMRRAPAAAAADFEDEDEEEVEVNVNVNQPNGFAGGRGL